MAWCTTLGNPSNEKDSRKAAVFRVDPPAQLFKVDTPYDLLIKDARIVEHTIQLTGNWFGCQDNVTCIFSLDGQLLNEESIVAAKQERALASGSGYELYHIAIARLKAMPFEDMPQEERCNTLQFLNTAITRDASDYVHANIRRRLGELMLFLGDKQEALALFTQAVDLNPKVGVKRLVDQLEKELRDS